MIIVSIADALSIHTQRWTNWFASRGHIIHLISSRLPSDTGGYSPAIRLHRLLRVPYRLRTLAGFLGCPAWPWQVHKVIGTIKPDLVEARFITITGYLGAMSGFHPFVVTVEGSDILVDPKHWYYRFPTKYTLRKADLIICQSPFMVDDIVQLGIEPSKVRTGYRGVDTQEFSPSRGKELRQTLAISNSAPVVISTRGLSPIYDAETMVRAIPLVLKQVPKAQFIIAGKGKQENYLESLVRRLGVDGHVKFVGSVPNHEVPQYLALSNVYVSTSLSDGVPNSLLEAMASGLAPVVTDIVANRGWVTEGQNGLLFPVKDLNSGRKALVFT